MTAKRMTLSENVSCQGKARPEKLYLLTINRNKREEEAETLR